MLLEFFNSNFEKNNIQYPRKHLYNDSRIADISEYFFLFFLDSNKNIIFKKKKYFSLKWHF